MQTKKVKISEEEPKMQPERVKVSNKEFKAAEEDGYVDGETRKKIYVYVELGKELDYIAKKSDDPNTEYRIFTNCCVCYAESEKERDDEIFVAEREGLTVIIYC